MERQFLLYKAVDADLVCSRVKVWDGSMVAIIPTLLGDETTTILAICSSYTIRVHLEGSGTWRQAYRAPAPD